MDVYISKSNNHSKGRSRSLDIPEVFDYVLNQHFHIGVCEVVARHVQLDDGFEHNHSADTDVALEVLDEPI